MPFQPPSTFIQPVPMQPTTHACLPALTAGFASLRGVLSQLHPMWVICHSIASMWVIYHSIASMHCIRSLF